MQNMADFITERKRIRIAALCKAWINISTRVGGKSTGLFELNPSLAVKVVNHYSDDLDVLKGRYNIPDRAQAPKVAGLMAASILKYRPLVPKDCLQLGVEENCLNEMLAIYHGICICAQYDEVGHGNATTTALIKKPRFRDWFNRIIFLVKERNYTSESLIAVFETLCLAAFPDGMVESQNL